MGILEPTTAETDLDIDTCIVPGRVFDRSGYRIGWGGGYYDRFLATYRGATIALAYDVQVLDEIPIEPHDIPVELIVTEREMIRCSQSSS
ncbi:5-formyltetrahydrofolate cyclo-ligase family protein [Exiguobacterium sp. S17]|nr:5-formyltetrahydrofolate cyclo-ligase family protein [Exiguobacterium sp. S17]